MNAYASILYRMKEKAETCLAHSLRRADRVLSQHYNEHLASVGLKVTQFSLLRALDLLGKTTASELQEKMIMEQATVSRGLKPLIRDGYIHVAEGSNKREKALSLTTAGKVLFKQALVPWQQAQNTFKQHLGEGGDLELVEMSRRIVAVKY
jgi:MarR family transcriptional regulator for hemolysin